MLCAAGQLLVFAMPGVPKYNGVRLFLPVFPFLAMLAGIGFDRLATWVLQGKTLSRYQSCQATRLRQQILFILAAAFLLPGFSALVTYHPFELSYYNQLVGGLRGAVRRGFEPTYWGETYVHTLSFFNKHAPYGATINIWPPGVVSYFAMFQRSGALRRDFLLTAGEAAMRSADYVVFHTRQSEMEGSPSALLLFRHGKPVFVVQHEGIALNVVFDRSEIKRVLGEEERTSASGEEGR